MHRLIEFLRDLFAAFRHVFAKRKTPPRRPTRRRPAPARPRCPECREYLADGETHDHDDDQDDTEEGR